MRRIFVSMGLAVLLLAGGCYPVSRSNFEKIEVDGWTREEVHALFGEPEARATSVDMPDREVYYQADELARPHAIVYYDDEGRVVKKEWKE